jgi:hypothetical protein
MTIQLYLTQIMFVIRRIKFETIVILDPIEQGHNLVHIVKKYSMPEE